NVDFVNYENGNMRFSTNGSTVRMTIDNSGNALIGASTPIQLLTVGGNAYKSAGGSAWDIPSDERLKTDIKPFLGGLNEVIQINPVWFKYNGLAGTNSDNQEIGVLAQNIKQSSPYMIKNLYDSTFGEYLGLNNGAMIYLLINSVKELKAKNDFLEQELIKFGLLNDSTNLTDDKNIKENSIINKFKGRLGENIPNPFLNTTTIEYEVSIDFKSAFLRIFDQNGNIIHIENIFNKGINLFQFNFDNSESKILYYSLIIDNQIIETKKMLKL
ncbi:MAG: tail fiber domain-containing protein, partial [Bacteroidia bacterium]|nr:tail fiber domain-containing protein [Bacteroidia bacterium]